MERPKFKNRTEKIQWYLDEIDSYKEDMGKWYTMFIRRILPFMLFIIPMNVFCEFVYAVIADRFLSGILDSSNMEYLTLMWIFALIVFLLILIFLPRFATFCEFVIGGWFLVWAFTAVIINTGLGYFTVITLSIFMFMKFVFLILEIIYHIVFRGEKAPTAYSDDTDVVF